MPARCWYLHDHQRIRTADVHSDPHLCPRPRLACRVDRPKEQGRLRRRMHQAGLLHAFYVVQRPWLPNIQLLREHQERSNRGEHFRQRSVWGCASPATTARARGRRGTVLGVGKRGGGTGGATRPQGVLVSPCAKSLFALSPRCMQSASTATSAGSRRGRRGAAAACVRGGTSYMAGAHVYVLLRPSITPCRSNGRPHTGTLARTVRPPKHASSPPTPT